MARMGRPLIQIDKKEFEKLCALQCTEEEIANFFECSVDTIERWCKREYKTTFAEIFKQKRSKGRIALRRYQLKLAENNTAMAIFLGKNWLGQTDRIAQTVMEVEDLSSLADMLKGDEDAHSNSADD